MHVVVTGYSNPKMKNNMNKFADIRLVVIQDTDDDVSSPSGNTELVAASLFGIFMKWCQNEIQQYHISTNNIRTEPKSSKGSAALRISLPFPFAKDFLNDSCWQNIFGRLLNNKAIHDNNGKVIGHFKIPFYFDPNDVENQIANSATQEDLAAAQEIYQDFIADLFKKLDSPDVQSFLRNYCGQIKLVDVSGSGWDLVQLSEKNSVMVYAQYRKYGITPTFVCNQRDWARFFNRTLKPNATPVVIEVPLNNKRLDKAKYIQVTGKDYDTDLQSGGSNAFRANWIGNNQHDSTTNFYPGWVYDISQTEVIQGMPDVFNDAKQQRRNTNLGNDTSLAFPTDTKPTSQDIAQGNASPFDENLGKIPECLDNIKKGISSDRFKNKKSGNGKYDSVIPILNLAITSSPNASGMKDVVRELAMCELYQVENVSSYNKKDNLANIIVNVVMSNCGFGSTYELADYARKVLNDRQEINKLYDAISNITNLINGSIKESIIKEELCKVIDYNELLRILGFSNDEIDNFNLNKVNFINNEAYLAENIKQINITFNNILKKLL